MIIYFSAQLPSKNIPIAGQKIANNHLIELDSPRNIILFSFVNNIEKPFFDKKEYSNYYSVCFRQTNKLFLLKNHLRFFSYPLKVTGRFNYGFFNKLLKKVDKHNINKVFFEFTSSLLYAQKLKEERPKIQIHFVEHDITFQSYYRLSKSKSILKRILYSIEYRRMKRFEISNLKKLDQVYTLNAKDKSILSSHGIKNVKIKYPKVEGWIYDVDRTKYEQHSILFLGAMHRKENQNAVVWFYENVLVSLIKRYPDLKFYVVGGKCPKNIKKLANKNIIFTGFVEDLKVYFEKIQVAVVPLNFGAGIKIKTLETINAKIPTYATEIGAEGVDNNGYLTIVNTPEEFLEILSMEFEKKIRKY